MKALSTFRPINRLQFDASICVDARMMPSQAKEARAGLVEKGLLVPTKERPDIYEINKTGLQVMRKLFGIPNSPKGPQVKIIE